MENRYTRQAQEALDAAGNYAKDFKHPYIGTEHLLLGLKSVYSGVAGQVLDMNGLKEDEVVKVVGELVSTVGEETFSGTPEESPRLKFILEESRKIAERFRMEEIGTEHMLLAIIQDTDCVAARILITLNLNLQKVMQDCLTAIGENPKAFAEKNEGAAKGAVLEQYCTDLTALAEDGRLDPVVGGMMGMQVTATAKSGLASIGKIKAFEDNASVEMRDVYSCSASFLMFSFNIGDVAINSVKSILLLPEDTRHNISQIIVANHSKANTNGNIYKKVWDGEVGRNANPSRAR